MAIVKGKTKSGFTFETDSVLLHDVEFLERFAASQKGSGLETFELIEQVLGAEQKAALYDHIRNEDGRVIVEDLTAELTDIFDVLGEAEETKN